MTGWLLVIFAAVVAVVLYPSGPTLRFRGRANTPGADAVGAVGRIYIAQLVAWAVVCVAMVAGLVAWAVLR